MVNHIDNAGGNYPWSTLYSFTFCNRASTSNAVDLTGPDRRPMANHTDNAGDK